MKANDKTAVIAVCIDDLALKKRQRYGTIMVDLHSHKLIGLIEIREMEVVKSWLKEYPNIKIVSRDGSRSYATAISEAHPGAIQISDRFHLLQNLTDYATLALQKPFQSRIAIPITDETRKYRSIMLTGTIAQKVALIKRLHKNGHNRDEIRMITGASEMMVKKYIVMDENNIPVEKQTSRGRGHEVAVEKVRQRAELVHALYQEGLGMAQISQRTSFTHTTIRNYLSNGFSPVNAHYGKQREGKLQPFRNEVLKLKSEGLKYREIHEILKKKGYDGTEDAIRGFIPKERRIHRDILSAGAGHEELVDKKWLIRLLYKPLEDVKGISAEQLDYVMSEHPAYKDILCAVNKFKDILKSKKPKSLSPWMDEVSALEIPEFNSFIEGIRLDLDAVMNAISYDYSNGLAEGTVNKIKVIKRIMYGRCRFPLLRNKCLLLDHFT